MHTHITHTPTHLQDMGTMVMGKVESGGLAKGMTLTLMPNKVCVDVHIYTLYWECTCVFLLFFMKKNCTCSTIFCSRSLHTGNGRDYFDSEERRGRELGLFWRQYPCEIEGSGGRGLCTYMYMYMYMLCVHVCILICVCTCT